MLGSAEPRTKKHTKNGANNIVLYQYRNVCGNTL